MDAEEDVENEGALADNLRFTSFVQAVRDAVCLQGDNYRDADAANLKVAGNTIFFFFFNDYISERTISELPTCAGLFSSVCSFCRLAV
jgi:hypothetical protein